MPDREKVLATLPKSDRIELRLSISEYQDRLYIHLREFEKNEGSDKFLPTKKGCAVSIDRGEELLAMFRELAKEMGRREEAKKSKDDDNDSLPF